MSKIIKVLITGGTGFLGSNLLPSLLLEDYEVFVITRKLPMEKKVKNLHYLKADLCDTKSLASIKREIRSCEILIDLAALIPVGLSFNGQNSVNDAIRNINVNIIGHVDLLNFVSKKLKKIIYASSIDVYGSSVGYEENSPTFPDTFYGASKLFMEHVYKIFCQRNNISPIILRFSQIYGHDEHPINVIPTFVKRIVSGQPLHVFGKGDDVRSFLYIDDAVKAICLATVKNKKGTFNVAGREAVSVKELVRTFQLLVRKPVGLKYFPRKKRLTKQEVCINKISKELGFKPSVSIKQGLAQVMSKFGVC